MTGADLVQEIEGFREKIASCIPALTFTYHVNQPPAEFAMWCQDWRQVIPDRQSGVYVLCTTDDEPIYIGKAAAGNLGARVWRHLRKNRIDGAGRKEFYLSEFLNSKEHPNVAEKIRSAVRTGQVTVITVTVDPPDTVHVLEGYLQTVYKRNTGRLPAFNRRIA